MSVTSLLLGLRRLAISSNREAFRGFSMGREPLFTKNTAMAFVLDSVVQASLYAIKAGHFLATQESSERFTLSIQGVDKKGQRVVKVKGQIALSDEFVRTIGEKNETQIYTRVFFQSFGEKDNNYDPFSNVAMLGLVYVIATSDPRSKLTIEASPFSEDSKAALRGIGCQETEKGRFLVPSFVRQAVLQQKERIRLKI